MEVLNEEQKHGKRFRLTLGSFRLSRVLRYALLIAAGIWVYKNYHKDLPLDVLQQRYAFPDSKFIEVEGMQVHYRMRGKGEPIILLHDASNSLHTWTGWVDSLSPEYQVVVVDLPGFGLTGPHPRGSYSTFMYVSFLEQFSKALGLQQFHLAGNGLGAQIAWFYATEHPERLKKLILLNAPGFEPRQFSLLQTYARTPVINRALWKITPRALFRILLENMYADDDKIDDALIQRHFDLLLRPGNRKAFTDRLQVHENRPPADIIEKITTPTLILWGAEDTQISPEYAYEFHRRIRKSLLRIYQNTGHWPQEELPEQTARDVHNFLKGRF